MYSKGKSKEFLFSVSSNDFEVQTFRSGGKGGQHQNKTSSGVRLIHKLSGARGESRDQRSQHSNKKTALKRLISSEKFQRWLRIKAAEILSGESIEEKVERSMSPKNLKVEILDENNEWIDEK